MTFNIWPFRRKAISTADIYGAILKGLESKTGQSVTTESALRVTTVLSCARVIAEGVAQVPLKIYRKDGRNRIPAEKHPLYDLLHRKPNDTVTSFGWRETLVLHAVLAKGGFAFVNRGPGGVILELVNLTPGCVEVNEQKRAGDPLTYTVRGKSGAEQIFPAAAIFHLKGPSWDGWDPLESTCRHASLSIL